ncbi:hypothetical protein SmJEL517_g02143 [Synchytrium microbalum]|uniref:HAD family hydrolase n=1 Tax=Synchytrium microbalum TaxID=1806994 RepID=A0A507CC66_9FUNG|nr:uncharacterized protein SmJEL517_g02143 [Synchytrium microbalum]TPX35534.1 hypothetical protein SmJEL517_g02143 [Synchytrium microbalum]
MATAFTCKLASIGHGLSSSHQRLLRGLVFDMDGTLTKPYLDFQEMRRRLGITPDQDIVQTLFSWSGEKRQQGDLIVREMEGSWFTLTLDLRLLQFSHILLRRYAWKLCNQGLLPAAHVHYSVEALRKTELQSGLTELFTWLDTTHPTIPRAILTRNALPSVSHILENHIPFKFHPVVTREFQPAKPWPDPLLHISQMWGIMPQEVAMIGDGKDDIECGRAAASVTILLRNPTNQHLEADLVIDELLELKAFLDAGFTVIR